MKYQKRGSRARPDFLPLAFQKEAPLEGGASASVSSAGPRPAPFGFLQSAGRRPAPPGFLQSAGPGRLRLVFSNPPAPGRLRMLYLSSLTHRAFFVDTHLVRYASAVPSHPSPAINQMPKGVYKVKYQNHKRMRFARCPHVLADWPGPRTKVETWQRDERGDHGAL